MRKRFFAVLLACAFVAFGSSCIGPLRRGGGERRTAEEIALRFGPSSPFAAPEAGASTGPAETATSSENTVYRMGIGDTLIIVLRTPNEQQFEMMVDENGVIKLPLLEPVRAVGRTMAELEEVIRGEYLGRKIYKYCTVNAFVTSRSYYVRGEVRQPGRYPLQGEITLLQALAAAGGYTDFANTRKIEILRGGRTMRVDAKDLERSPEKDLPLENADIIIVPRGIF